jgi:hypothetical protein
MHPLFSHSFTSTPPNFWGCHLCHCRSSDWGQWGHRRVTLRNKTWDRSIGAGSKAGIHFPRKNWNLAPGSPGHKRNVNVPTSVMCTTKTAESLPATYSGTPYMQSQNSLPPVASLISQSTLYHQPFYITTLCTYAIMHHHAQHTTCSAQGFNQSACGILIKCSVQTSTPSFSLRNSLIAPRQQLRLQLSSQVCKNSDCM